MSLKYNDAAERVLTERGYHCEPEPEWVAGKVPDFFCTGKAELWVEVKSLDEPKEMEISGKVLQWFRKLSHTIQSYGRAFAMVSDDASQRDVRVALGIADDALARMREGRDDARRVFVVIPNDPEYGEYVRITAQADDGTEVFHCCKSATGKYGRPHVGGEIRWGEAAVVIQGEGHCHEASPCDLGLLDDDFLLALKLELAEEAFAVTGVMRRGMAIALPNVKKFRRAADRANRKFTNACRHREVPCLLMVFHDDIFVSEDEAFASAFYGDLQVTFPVDSTERDTGMSFGPNSAWGPTKNRTTSAACYVRNNASPIMLHNLWAKNPLPNGLFDCVEYVPKEDGTFEKLGLPP